MKISELPEPYKALAKKRRKEDGEYPNEDRLNAAFFWENTPEGHRFWDDVCNAASLPNIPKASIKEMPTQSQQILQHLQQAPITPMQALESYGVFRLAARINELRNKGHNIATTKLTRNGKTFAEYKLVQQ